jgi:UDP-N-acetylglucosamine--N-acetylmuramyl-(pentapeptide) pyrophosphoryl-undecaprenol N-acetylglucosamine transferase
MRYAQDFAGDIVVELPVANIRQGGFFNKIKNSFSLIKSIIVSIGTIIKYKPTAIIGFGGYPSFPAAIAGILTFRPLFIHEQNAILGRTNRFLYRFAKKICLSFDNTQNIKKQGNVIHTGNPVRSQIHEYADVEYPAIQDKFYILVTGGSQGASIFSTMIPEICRELPKDIQQKICITHQTRPEDIQTTTKLYKDYKINAIVTDFIADMGKEIAQSHLVICRSGASTLAEIGIIGRPALFVPLPTAADDQQTINAQMAVNVGAARLIRQQDFTKTYVASILTEYYMHPKKLFAMANQIKTLVKSNASHLIAEIIDDSV